MIAFRTGRVQVTIQAASIAESFVKAGTLRPIAVAGSKRIGSLPDVPAISETLESVDLQGWFMLMAPAGTPTDIIQKLSAEIARTLNSPEVQERAPTLGFDVGIDDAVTPAGAKLFLEERLRPQARSFRNSVSNLNSRAHRCLPARRRWRSRDRCGICRPKNAPTWY